MKLDKSKPYAQVIGSDDGSRFEQNGILYDFEGNQLNKTAEHVEVQGIIDAPKKRGPKPKQKDI